MLSGSEEIWYTPVEAYGVSTFAGGISSGGMGGDATVTEGVRFLWKYDPESPRVTPSGFTGKGWFENTYGSPIWYSIQFHGMDLDTILAEFANNSRVNLNDIFKNWQVYVDAQEWQNNDVVQQFQRAVDYDCWSNLN